MITRCEVNLTAFSGGMRFSLNNIEGWILSTYDGLGIANVRRLFERSPGQDGDTDRGFNRDPRFILLTWEQLGCTLADLWDLRCLIQGIFRPRAENDPVQLVFRFPNGTRRAADVHMEGVLDHTTSNRLGTLVHRISIVLKASDPRLYDPTQKVFEFAFDNAGGWDIAPDAPPTYTWLDNIGWDIAPTSVMVPATNRKPNPPVPPPPVLPSFGSGWNVGVSVFDLTDTISYAQGKLNADVEFPIIRLRGPIDNAIITNETTDEILPFTAEGGLSIIAGNYVDIDLRFGFKTVLDQDGNDVSEFLEEDNDLATFHLSYATELLSDGTRSTGDNVITVEGDNVTAQTSVTISYFERYVGA